MTAAGLVPDRRRTRLPLNGGPRPTGSQAEVARRGIAAARAALNSHSDAPTVVEPTVDPLDPADRAQALTGIREARTALRNA